jgi:hypothetical protein
LAELGNRMAQRDHTGQRILKDGAIYSLALTPYQYVARKYAGVHRATIAWVLVPRNADNALIGGPALFVTPEGTIGMQDGLSDATTNDLDFTGRYADATQPSQPHD